jgi:hypothetical protein
MEGTDTDNADFWWMINRMATITALVFAVLDKVEEIIKP